MNNFKAEIINGNDIFIDNTISKIAKEFETFECSSFEKGTVSYIITTKILEECNKRIIECLEKYHNWH